MKQIDIELRNRAKAEGRPYEEVSQEWDEAWRKERNSRQAAQKDK